MTNKYFLLLETKKKYSKKNKDKINQSLSGCLYLVGLMEAKSDFKMYRYRLNGSMYVAVLFW
jgi:hypothetical protein